MLNSRKFAQTLVENDLLMHPITWLAGTVLSVDDDFIKDAILPVVDRAPWVHPSMEIFSHLPQWAETSEGFVDWILAEDIFGFVFRAMTPRPVEFHSQTRYTTASFGYCGFTYIYVEDMAEAVPAAIEWRKGRMKAWYQEDVLKQQGRASSKQATA